MGLCAKIWYCLCGGVVPQVINPKRAAAQNWSHPFPIGLIAFSGRIRAPYKILSRSVQKQKSYSISIFALIAPQDLSENVNVRNSWFLKSRLWNHDLIAKIMIPSIYQLNTFMSLTYCYKTERFFLLDASLHLYMRPCPSVGWLVTLLSNTAKNGFLRGGRRDKEEDAMRMKDRQGKWKNERF